MATLFFKHKLVIYGKTEAEMAELISGIEDLFAKGYAVQPSEVKKNTNPNINLEFYAVIFIYSHGGW